MTGSVPGTAATGPAHEEPERASETAPSRAPRRRSRWRPWLVLLAIVVAIRLLLTIVLTPLAEERLSRLVGTRVDVGDVTFAPIDAVVTLRNVVVHPAGESVAAAPTITAKRVQLDVQWLPLLHRSLLLRELRVEGARGDLERLHAAGWTLERVQRLHPETELPTGWSFALDRVVLRDTAIRLGAVGIDDAQGLDVTVREARVSTRRRRASAFGRVPNLRVDAVVGDGRLLIDGSSDIRDDGVAITARVHAKRLPLRPFAAYRPAFLSESPVAGRVSARLVYQRDPGRRDRLTGHMRGQRMRVRVPTLDTPALAVRRVDAEVAGIDLLQRRIAITSLTLRGADLAVRPDLMAPVPLFDGLARSPASPATDPPPTRHADTWGWTIGHLEAPAARLIVAEPGAQRALAASVSGDSISPAAYWSPLRAAIGWDGGTAMFDGILRMTRGFAIEGRLTASDMDAAMVIRAVDPPLATLVQTGRVAVDLDVELIPGTADGPPLGVQGRISVTNLWLAAEDPNVFAFGAHTLDLTQARIVPVQDGGERSQAMQVEVGTASLTSPYLRLKRTTEGWSFGTATQTTEDEPEVAAASDELEVAATSTVALAVASMSVRDGQVSIVDETAAPAFSLDLSALGGSVRQLRLPAAGFPEFDVQGRDSRLGPVRLAAARSGGEVRAELAATDFGLAAVSPYFQRAGLPYPFTGGRGAVRSLVSLAGDRWTADTTLWLTEPVLGGDEGMLERSLGMAPAAALAAVYDRHGEVMLRLPLASAKADAQGLAEAFAAGVRDALARPQWVPLPDAPIQVRFPPGHTQPGPEIPRQLEAIADILAARPDTMLELRGVISRVDRRWFAEQTVAANWTDEPGGLKVLLRAVGVRDQRLRIRDALSERSAGRPGTLDAKDEAALSVLVAAVPAIPDERVAMLASSRAALVAKLLADQHGVVAVRVIAGEPAVPDSTGSVVDARFLPTPGLGPR